VKRGPILRPGRTKVLSTTSVNRVRKTGEKGQDMTRGKATRISSGELPKKRMVGGFRKGRAKLAGLSIQNNLAG